MSKSCKEYDKPLAHRAFAAPMAFCVLAVLLTIFAAPALRAQGTSLLSSSYITPFPQTDRYQVRVIGDWLGPGLTEGLKEAFKQESSLEIADMSRSNYGLVRAEQIDLYGEIDRMIAGPPVHVAIIMLGVNDRASIRAGAGRAQPGAAEWKEAYAKEAQKLIKKLKGANIAVYWVGLPVMGNPAFSESAAQMNDAVRQAAYVNGVKFIEILGRLHRPARQLQRLRPRSDRPDEAASRRGWRWPDRSRDTGNLPITWKRRFAATSRTQRVKGIFRLSATRRNRRAWFPTGRITLPPAKGDGRPRERAGARGEREPSQRSGWKAWLQRDCVRFQG